MAKIDIESAYRLIPVHPMDRNLQAVEWEGKVYVDPMLPFGLRSAPKLFNAVADGLEWYLRRRGIQHVFHYLDDFIVVAPPASPDCAIALDILNESWGDRKAYARKELESLIGLLNHATRALILPPIWGIPRGVPRNCTRDCGCGITRGHVGPRDAA